MRRIRLGGYGEIHEDMGQGLWSLTMRQAITFKYNVANRSMSNREKSQTLMLGTMGVWRDKLGYGGQA